MKRIITIIISLLFVWQLAAHPWKPSHYVIIDTDCGIDDIRAICMLLASPDVRVMAITVSGGALDPGTGYVKIKSLLRSFHHHGIPVGINRAPAAENLALPGLANWGDESDVVVPDQDNYLKIITNVLDNETTNIDFISLGSLNTVNGLLNSEPAYMSRINRIVWSNQVPHFEEGFNYRLDIKSANAIIQSGISLNIVGESSRYDLYSDSFIEELGMSDFRYPKSIYNSFIDFNSENHGFLKKGADDFVPIFLHYPSLYTTETEESVTYSVPGDPGGIRSAMAKILSGKTVQPNQVIKAFPTDTSFYMADVQRFMTDIIANNGLDEWNCGILANELHRHLGVYAIIGVKMGILAREYFHIGVDEMRIVSRAGSIPPLSCMNDGIQVSTGATAGHGLLKVINENCSPSVEFTYHDKKIIISLKDEIRDQIDEELKEINFVYGLDSNIYWELVRQKALLYWKNLSRYDIFILAETE